MNDDLDAVMGRLAACLQQLGAPLGGVPLEYLVRHPSYDAEIVLMWRGGPLATKVADTLIAAGRDHTGMAVEQGDAWTPAEVRLLVNGVAVRLIAKDPVPDELPRSVVEQAERPDWPWPWFLLTIEGLAHDSVFRTMAEADSEVSVVQRVGTAATTSALWSETGLLVANADYEPPAYASAFRAQRHRRLYSVADIRLVVANDWNVDQADDWLAAGSDPRYDTSVPQLGAVLLADRAVMRLRQGLRVEATIVKKNPHTSMAMSVLPSAVYDQLSRRPDGTKNPPTELRVRMIGDAWNTTEFTLDCDVAAPLSIVGY
ncbi:hypothetical protein AB0I53_12015 [Saccharopolyspora sp. NPDC050389]|uniref:hypothetical protein n=1 Tax=Saccharopolyspora sp. NPDC050389 TaxID=3155516 RepID=UPI0033ED60A9